MEAGKCCIVPPFFFRKKLSVNHEKIVTQAKKDEIKIEELEDHKDMKGFKVCKSPVVEANLVLMNKLLKEISSFRDLLDFPPCNGSSVNELIKCTLKDLYKTYPLIRQTPSVTEVEGVSILQVYDLFFIAIESLGHFWTNGDEWMEKSRNKSCHKLDLDELEELALAKLEDINKLARERLFDMMDEDEQQRGDYSPPSNTAFGKALSRSYSDNSKSFFPGSPATPTSVLPEITHISSDGEKINVSSPSLFHLRVQALGKLNPIDVKRLSFHMFPHVATQDPNFTIQYIDPVKDLHRVETIYDFVVEQPTEDVNDQCSDEMLIDTPEVQEKEATESDGKPSFLAPISVIKKDYMDVILPPPTLKRLHPNVTEKDGPELVAPPSPPPLQTQSLLVYSKNSVSGSLSPPPPPPPPPPPLPHLPNISSKDTIFSPLPPPPPPPPPVPSNNIVTPPFPLSSSPPPHPSFGGQNVAPPPPPPPMGARAMVPPPMGGNGAVPPPPPPILGNGGAPPPPPPPIGKGGPGALPPPPGLVGDKNLRPKKAVTKLKRSSQMGNLYRLLKGKVEGSCLTGKTQGKGKIGAPAGGKQGMADALAEMTKRSAYFIQIEADAKNHAQAIREVKVAINSFQTLDMAELIKFHKYVESHLEKLADESQVLARFEDFPTKKLEALRMSAALYSKLESIVQTLQNWQVVSPVNQVLDKIENYFTKIKTELDALERTKDEEAKKFQAHKITFDFSVLIHIKELMVDISSSCMELALKEKREVKTNKVAEKTNQKKLFSDGKKNGSGKVMWKAFQFAYRVYSFAGGHDDRADMLTRELAQEIETDPHP